MGAGRGRRLFVYLCIIERRCAGGGRGRRFLECVCIDCNAERRSPGAGCGRRLLAYVSTARCPECAKMAPNSGGDFSYVSVLRRDDPRRHAQWRASDDYSGPLFWYVTVYPRYTQFTIKAAKTKAPSFFFAVHPGGIRYVFLVHFALGLGLRCASAVIFSGPSGAQQATGGLLAYGTYYIYIYIERERDGYTYIY